MMTKQRTLGIVNKVKELNTNKLLMEDVNLLPGEARASSGASVSL